MNKKFLGLIIAIFLIPPCVKADEYKDKCDPLSLDRYCLDLEESTAYEKVDKDLNIAYKKVISKLVPGNDASEDDEKYIRELKTSFIEAQRQWIIFRDLECNAWSQLPRITELTHHQVLMQCLEDITINRTKQLEQWLLEL